MNLIITLIGFLALWTVLKFVFLVFKRLGSKNNMNKFIDGMEYKMSEGADKVATAWKNRKRKEPEKPTVTIH